jgi:hypothetical protein
VRVPRCRPAPQPPTVLATAHCPLLLLVSQDLDIYGFELTAAEMATLSAVH